MREKNQRERPRDDPLDRLTRPPAEREAELRLRETEPPLRPIERLPREKPPDLRGAEARPREMEPRENEPRERALGARDGATGRMRPEGLDERPGESPRERLGDDRAVDGARLRRGLDDDRLDLALLDARDRLRGTNPPALLPEEPAAARDRDAEVDVPRLDGAAGATLERLRGAKLPRLEERPGEAEGIERPAAPAPLEDLERLPELTRERVRVPKVVLPRGAPPTEGRLNSKVLEDDPPRWRTGVCEDEDPVRARLAGALRPGDRLAPPNRRHADVLELVRFEVPLARLLAEAGDEEPGRDGTADEDLGTVLLVGEALRVRGKPRKAPRVEDPPDSAGVALGPPPDLAAGVRVPGVVAPTPPRPERGRLVLARPNPCHPGAALTVPVVPRAVLRLPLRLAPT